MASFPTARFVALRPPFRIWPAQFVQVFPRKLARSASYLLVSAAPTGLLFSFSFSLTLAVSTLHCSLLCLSFYLKLSGRSGRDFLLSPPLHSGYNGSSNNRFSRGTTRWLSWPDRERYSCPLQSLVVFLLIPLVSSLLFSRTGSVLPHPNSLSHSYSRCLPRNLCSFITLAVFSSSLLQRTHPSFKLLSH